MAQINLTNVEHKTFTYAEDGEAAACLKDTGNGKVRIMSVHNDKFRLTNVADDQDVLEFSSDA